MCAKGQFSANLSFVMKKTKIYFSLSYDLIPYVSYGIISLDMRQPCISYGRLSVRKKMVFADADTDSPIFRRVKRVRVEVYIYIYIYII